ncbi:MAG TPA: hypothetical protein PLG47_01460 [Candidatus Dojkabacteria bacterium]|nr:hypothetical protein [Candidatus Dojkabacteria bacterium]
MKIVERFNNSVEYYPSKGCRFVKRDRTAVYPWFLILKKGESINDYEELPEGEAAQIEQILQERNSEEPIPEQKRESTE